MKFKTLTPIHKEVAMQSVDDITKNSITEIQNKLTNIWNYTELEMSDYSTTGLKKHLAKISEIVNDVIVDLEEFKTCSMCQYNLCEECMDDIAEELDDIAPHN